MGSWFLSLRLNFESPINTLLENVLLKYGSGNLCGSFKPNRGLLNNLVQHYFCICSLYISFVKYDIFEPNLVGSYGYQRRFDK